MKNSTENKCIAKQTFGCFWKIRISHVNITIQNNINFEFDTNIALINIDCTNLLK